MRYRSVAFPPSAVPSWWLEVAPLPARGQGAEALLCAGARLPGGARKLGSITGLCIRAPWLREARRTPSSWEMLQGGGDSLYSCEREAAHKGSLSEQGAAAQAAGTGGAGPRQAPPEGSALTKPCFQGRSTPAKATTL